MNYLKQFTKHISNHDYSSFLTLWEEYCMGDSIDEKELDLILQGVKNSDLADPFGRHVEEAVSLWEMLDQDPVADRIIQNIFDLQTTNTPELAKLALTYLKNKYGKDSHFAEMIRLVGLRDGVDFQGCISDFILLRHMAKGNFVFHNAGWGVGEIMDISFVREELNLEFDYVSGRKDLSFKNAFKTLKPIESTHFLARRFGNPDELELFAKKDPNAVIRMALKDLGPLNAAELKEELCELVIPVNEWARWWQTARNRMKKDTLIEMPRSLSKPFILREQAVSHENLLLDSLEKESDPASSIARIYTHLRDFPASLKNEEFKKELENKLKEILSKEISDAEELQVLFLLEDIHSEEKDSSSAEELIKRLQSLDHVVQGLKIVAFKKKALFLARKLRNDWEQVFLDLLVNTSENPIREYLLTELLAEGKLEQVKKRLEELIAFPNKHPQMFLWYLSKIMKKADLPYGDNEGVHQFFEAFLILLCHIENSGEHKELIKRMHNFLTSNRYANVRKIFQNASIETLQEFLLLSTKCYSLSDHDIKIFHSLAEVVHPELKKLMSGKYDEPEEEEEQPIWTTEAGYQGLKEKIAHIGTVETVDNAKEIEAARQLGDLRENAEFKAALERRDRLQSELKLLSSQFNKCRILTKQDVPTDKVGIGTIIDCESPSGEITSITLLGPFEADPQKNILSFQSKLAKEMTGRKVGDKITLQGNENTIVKIRNYFD